MRAHRNHYTPFTNSLKLHKILCIVCKATNMMLFTLCPGNNFGPKRSQLLRGHPFKRSRVKRRSHLVDFSWKCRVLAGTFFMRSVIVMALLHSAFCLGPYGEERGIQYGRRCPGELRSGRDIDASAFSDTIDSLWFKDKVCDAFLPSSLCRLCTALGVILLKVSK